MQNMPTFFDWHNIGCMCMKAKSSLAFKAKKKMTKAKNITHVCTLTSVSASAVTTIGLNFLT